MSTGGKNNQEENKKFQPEQPTESKNNVLENDNKIAKYFYELQKAHQDSTETVKLSCFHLPYRLFLAFSFIFDILTDLLVIIEMFDKNADQNKIALLIFFILSMVGMICMNCGSLQTTSYPLNGCLRLIFALFSLLGLDSVMYFIYSGLTLQGHTMHDYKINGPRSPRKFWGAWQSVLSAFITAHYIFYEPNSSALAVISMFSSMLQARLTMNMNHTGDSFIEFLKNEVFCMRFFSTFFEILGRPLFYAATTIIVIQKSTFLDSSSKPYRLTYEFFAWDGIALGSTCAIMFIVYMLMFKSFKVAFSLMIQNFIGSALIRPAVDKNDLESVKIASRMVTFLQGNKENNEKDLKRQIQFGLGFPCLWRIFEYIGLNIVIYHYEYLDIAEERDDSILYLAYLAIIVNAINSVILLITVGVLLVVKPQFNKNLSIPSSRTHKAQIALEKMEKDVVEGGEKEKVVVNIGSDKSDSANPLRNGHDVVVN